jgi:hypothetical protein
LSVAVIVPAEKFPDASRATMAPGVMSLVAVVAELATLPAAVIVDSLVSAMAAESEMSALVIVPSSMVVPETDDAVARDPKPKVLRWAVASVPASKALPASVSG